MKILCMFLALASLGGASKVEVIAKSEPLVKDAEAIFYDGQWYVALQTEPIYTLSERAELCNALKDKIALTTGMNADVLIDVSLFFDIKHAKTLSGNEQSEYIEKRIKRIFLRRSYEYSGNYQTEEKRATALC